MECTCKHDAACSSCPESLADRQEKVVRHLQGVLTKQTWPSGQAKDYALALGVAVDKLLALRAKRPTYTTSQFYNQLSGTAINRAVPAGPQNT